MEYWVNEFNRGRTNIGDAPRPGSPKSAVMTEKIDKVHDMVLANKRVKARDLAKAVGILIYRIHFNLNHKLHMKEMCPRWVPRLPTLEQKRNHMRTSIDWLQLFKKNSADFFSVL